MVRISYSMAFFIVALYLFFSSCNTKKSTELEVLNESFSISTDTTKVILYPDEVNSIGIIYTDNEEIKAWMSPGDIAEFSTLIAYTTYDTVWNDRGIMIKMISPDYTLVINYKTNPDDNNEWVPIWKSSGKLKFRQKWYIIDEKKRNNIYELIEKHRKD